MPEGATAFEAQLTVGAKRDRRRIMCSGRALEEDVSSTFDSTAGAALA